MTVALGLENKRNVLLKGIDLILELAKNNPDYTITIIGSDSIYGYNDSLKNVKLIGKVAHNELISYYNKNQFYLQLSISESFGLSLCEAILCGCVPIVSNVGMMPQIVENQKFVLNKKCVIELQNLINEVSGEKYVNKNSILERQKSIIDRFSFETRKLKLLKIVESLI
jgi:glycosyltransferase involved in cell wall biosynthesis